MSVWEIIKLQDVNGAMGIGTIAVITILSLIQVSKIPINPWSWIAAHIGRAINSEVLLKVSDLESKVSSLQSDMEQERVNRIEAMDLDRAERARTRILRFNDEIINGIYHTREYFNDVLRDVDMYENYCGSHPKYKNTQATEAIENVKRVFRKCETENCFGRKKAE